MYTKYKNRFHFTCGTCRFPVWRTNGPAFWLGWRLFGGEGRVGVKPSEVVLDGQSILGLRELDVESDRDLLTNENATRLKNCVPGQAEVFAIDLCARRDHTAGITPRIPPSPTSKRARAPNW